MAHQPGEDRFEAILQEEITWKTLDSLPPTVSYAALVGDPEQPGPYLIRVKVPYNVKIPPHKHAEDRIYTVMSGVFYIGRGDEFAADKLTAYAPGSVIVLPSNSAHFHWAKSGEYVTQISAIGPLGTEYVHAADDPRAATRA